MGQRFLDCFFMSFQSFIYRIHADTDNHPNVFICWHHPLQQYLGNVLHYCHCNLYSHVQYTQLSLFSTSVPLMTELLQWMYLP